MNRRSYLRRAGTAVTVATAGCIGGGGEVVLSVRQDVTVPPHSGWAKEIPDVSDPGGAISYLARADYTFDVYLFVGNEQYRRYRDWVNGREVSDLPSGDQEIGQTAIETDDMYEAATDDDGGRMSIDRTGPYYFVLDNSNYPASGGAFISDSADARRIQLDLTVTEQRYGL